MNRLGITTFLKNIPVGTEFDSKQWSPHITQVDTFKTEKSLRDVIKTLEQALSLQDAVTAEIESKEMIGPEKDIAVMKVAKNRRVDELHQRIVEALESLKVEFRRPFILKDKFYPHITVSPEISLNVGDKVEIGQITIIDKNDPDVRKVVCNINLQ